MKAFLVRIGVDQAYGGWNAPVDPVSGEFVYVPIPEKDASGFHPGCCHTYAEAASGLDRFCAKYKLEFRHPLDWAEPMHLDPDFERLTYGDDGKRRGAGIAQLKEDDLLVFYAGLRPISKCDHKVLYALVGLYVVADVANISDIPEERWPDNAHTRKLKHGPTDIVVRAKRHCSGRLDRCLPIGEWRDRAYRIRNDLLKSWGGLSAKNGYVQRSAVPPAFLQPERFLKWLKGQKVELLERNF